MYKIIYGLGAIIALLLSVYYLKSNLVRPIVRAVAFSQDELLVAAVGGDVGAHSGEEYNGRIWIWDIKNNTLKWSLVTGQENLSAVSFDSPNSLLTSNTKGEVEYWRLSNSLHKTKLPRKPIVVYRRSIFSFSTEKEFQEWNKYLQKILSLKNHAGQRADVPLISRNGKLAVVIDPAMGTQLWATSVPKLLWSSPTIEKTAIFSFDGEKIAFGGNNKIFLCRSSNGAVIQNIVVDGGIFSLVFTHDSEYIAAICNLDKIHIFSTNKGHLLRTFKP